MPLTMYGIANCDTVAKARKWLDNEGVPYRFHDYKKSGIDADTLRGWIDELGWEALLNKSGTTFKKLPDGDKAGIDADKALMLMLSNPSMIKRPVVDTGETRLVGFKATTYEDALLP
ncbi:hypothetical protein M527_13980 [Sphingobium indicum IP26]|nr:hypothetical protein M527_13980 [Sphingobium indicum IP26]